MGGEDDCRPFRHLIEFIDKQRAFGLKLFDHETVMNDFMADIDRPARDFERPLDNLNGAIDTRAKAARPCKDDGEFG
jgi:hypothetical protein